ncbi:MAG: SPFH domain-containing protein [Candidatus Diapherotrites archaeon]|nr:SPFH domain-containing protein [Candidatus Diapherotrites archaeon]
MSKRLGKVESYKLKELIFVLIILILLLSAAAIFIFREIVQIYILVGFFALFVIILISRYDFLLTLKEYERAVVFRFGRASRVGGPGWTFIIPVIESAKLVDLRTQTLDVKPQEVITVDKVVVTIDAVIYMFVKKENDAVMKSVLEIDDYRKGAEQFVVSSIRDAAGALTLSELISSVEKLNKEVKEKLEQITNSWGVSIEAVEIQNLTVPKQISDAFSEQKAAEQKKLARGELALAHGLEIDAVREAAEKLSDKALSYYYIRALERLGRGKSTKYLFPMELTQLASSLAGGHKNNANVEELFKKYAPAVKRILSEKKRPARRPAKKKAKRRK